MEQTKIMQIVSRGIATKFPLYVKPVYNQPDTAIHGHEFVELVLITSGRGTHISGGKSRTLSRGDIFVIPRGFCHEYTGTENLDLVNVLYIPELLPMPLLDIAGVPGFEIFYKGKATDSGQIFFMHLAEKDFLIMENYLTDMEEENCTRRSGFQFNLIGLFMALLGKLMRVYSFYDPSNTDGNDNINQVTAYLHRNFRKRITVEQLCRVSGMSRSSFMRKFTAYTGTAPLHYQMQLRIAEAIQLLQMTAKPLGEIAFELGFSDSNYFGRQFKKFVGVSPVKFRKQNLRTDKH